MSSISLVKSLEQKRASFAYEKAEEGLEISEKTGKIGQDYYEDKDKMYAAYARKIPSLIKTNGLAPALAFVFSKRKKPDHKNNKKIPPGEKENPKNAYDLLYLHIYQWLVEERKLLKTNLKDEDNFSLIKALVNCDSSTYRHLTLEVLALLGWIKRFSEGLAIEKGVSVDES